MAGGYAENIDDVVDIHFATVTTALACRGATNARDAKPRIRSRVAIAS